MRTGNVYPLWKRIKEVLETYDEAIVAAKEEFVPVQSDALAEWDAEVKAQEEAFAALLAKKEEDWQAASDDAQAAWDAALNKAVTDFTTDKAKIIANINVYIDEKVAELDLRYNALTENISHIYDFHLQHKSQADLDAAREAAVKECRDRKDEVNAIGYAARDAF